MDEYRNYWFHIKGFFIGEGLAIVVCALAGLVVSLMPYSSIEQPPNAPDTVEVQVILCSIQEIRLLYSMALIHGHTPGLVKSICLKMS